MDNLLTIKNGQKINRKDIPHLSFESFRQE